MNKSAHEDFKVTPLPQAKTAMHYQMRDLIIMPIITRLATNNFQVNAPQKNENSIFKFVGVTPNSLTARSEMMQLSISNNGTICLENFIPFEFGRNPVTRTSLDPHQDTPEKFQEFLDTFCEELKRFNRRYFAIIDNCVLHHDPIGQYQKLTRKSHLKPTPTL